MAISQSTALLNLGVDVVKATANAASQNSVNNGLPNAAGEDGFAQTLRKQLNNQAPSNPVAQAAKQNANAAKALPPGQAVRAQTPAGSKDEAASATSAARSEEAASQANATHNPSRSEESASNEAANTSNSTEHSSDSSDPQTAETSATGENTARGNVGETAQERKKRLLQLLAAEGGQVPGNPAVPATAEGLTPWMQSMLAMRQSGQAAATATDTDAAVSAAAGGGIDIATGVTTAPTSELPTDSTVVSDPVAASDAAEGRDKALNLGRLMRDAVQEGLSPGRAEGLQTNPGKGLGVEQGLAQAPGQAFADTLASLTTADSTQAAPPIASTGVTATAANTAWMQAAGLTQTPAAVSQLNTPFGNERWQAAMNQHVMNMVGAGDEVASLTLSPPDLGPIQVVLKVDQQSVNTSFISDNPLVRQALEDGMQDLKERMQSQGLQLGQTFIGNGQQAQQHFEQATAASPRASATASDADDSPAPISTAPVRVARGLVDTFV